MTLQLNSAISHRARSLELESGLEGEDGCKMEPALANETFERVKAQLRARLGKEVFTSWFERIKLVDATASVVRLSVPTTFLRSWINSHYLGLILEFWQAAQPGVLRVEILVRSAARHALPESGCQPVGNAVPRGPERPVRQPNAVRVQDAIEERAGRSASGHVLGSPLDPKYSFATFVEGPSNCVAFAAARSVADQSPLNASRCNPLFIHSAVGLGKTHLLQAIASETLKRHPNLRVVYLTAEYFMWRFATAIRDNNALTFKEQLRDIDLLVIDDMQFLQGKSIQREFCHLINTLLDSARQVVVAADRPPSELESLEPRVRSRLNGGIALEMEAPDHGMRLAMLRQRLEQAKAEEPSLNISDAILEHIATVVTGSGRELEGAFNQLLFRHSFEPQLTVDRVDELLGHIYRSGEPKRVRIEEIQRIVSRHYNVSRNELLSNRRTRVIVKPRQVAMYLSKMLTPRSLPEIGRRFGGRDHTTVLHAVRKIEGLTETDTSLAQEIELLKRLIQEQA